jgi:hypothetical protein
MYIQLFHKVFILVFNDFGAVAKLTEHIYYKLKHITLNPFQTIEFYLGAFNFRKGLTTTYYDSIFENNCEYSMKRTPISIQSKQFDSHEFEEHICSTWKDKLVEFGFKQEAKSLKQEDFLQFSMLLDSQDNPIEIQKNVIPMPNKYSFLSY